MYQFVEISSGRRQLHSAMEICGASGKLIVNFKRKNNIQQKTQIGNTVQ